MKKIGELPCSQTPKKNCDVSQYCGTDVEGVKIMDSDISPGTEKVEVVFSPLKDDVLKKIAHYGHNHTSPLNAKFPVDHTRWFYWFETTHLLSRPISMSAINEYKALTKEDSIIP